MSSDQKQLVDFAIEELRKRVKAMSDLYPGLEDLTRRALEHAINLTDKADELEK